MRISLLLIIVLLFSCAKNTIASRVPESSINREGEIIKNETTPIRQMDKLHQRLEDYTVALVALTKENGEKIVTPYCTGVWVGADEILSAGHCVKDEAAKPWETPVGKGVYYVIKSELDNDMGVAYHGGKVISFSEKPDLVLIKIEGKRVSHLVAGLASELPAIGEVVYGVGHPDTLAWTFVTGEVSAYRKNVFGNIIQVDMTIWSGNSGGGLFDREGKLIGICGWKTGIPGMGYYIQIDEIKKFIFEGRLANSK